MDRVRTMVTRNMVNSYAPNTIHANSSVTPLISMFINVSFFSNFEHVEGVLLGVPSHSDRELQQLRAQRKPGGTGSRQVDLETNSVSIKDELHNAAAAGGNAHVDALEDKPAVCCRPWIAPKYRTGSD